MSLQIHSLYDFTFPVTSTCSLLDPVLKLGRKCKAKKKKIVLPSATDLDQKLKLQKKKKKVGKASNFGLDWMYLRIVEKKIVPLGALKNK